MNMKTAVTVLQELMVKRNQQAEYTCVSQSGPEHIARFEYRCSALGVSASAIAGSKKEAKQAAARQLLLLLSARGQPVPPPFNMPSVPMSSTSANGGRPVILGAHSYVALLKDLCIEYHLPAVDFELIGDAGPPHLRMFTVRASIGQHERIATANSKKAARQMAAEQLYVYMRENLARLTKDFIEEDALARQHDRVMERFVEMRDETVWRPDLGQRVADYHIGLLTHSEPEKCELARRALEYGSEGAEGDSDGAAQSTLMAAITALGLTLTESKLEADAKTGSLTVLELSPTSPALCFCARSPHAAYRKAADHLRKALS